jgi:hypothetical protein
LSDISTPSSNGKKSKFITHYSIPFREAAILVLGIISGFKSEFKQIEPQLK